MNWRLAGLFGLLIALATGFPFGLNRAANGEDDEEREEQVRLDQVPDAVKATMLVELLREFDALKLEELEREIEGDAVIYEAEFEYRNKEIELKIAANGKLLSKEVEVEEDDDDDENDDDDDDENDDDA